MHDGLRIPTISYGSAAAVHFCFGYIQEKMKTQPWLFNSIEALYTHQCPECEFTHKAENDFQNHAVENHPLSFAFFGKTENETDIAIEENDIFDSGFKKVKVG